MKGLSTTGLKAELYNRLIGAWEEEGLNVEEQVGLLEERLKESTNKEPLEGSKKGDDDGLSNAGSGISNKSSRSELIRSRAKASARRRALEVRAGNLQKKRELEEKAIAQQQKLKHEQLKQQQEQLKLQQELDEKMAALAASTQHEKEQLAIATELAEVQAEEEVWNRAEQEITGIEVRQIGDRKEDVINKFLPSASAPILGESSRQSGNGFVEQYLENNFNGGNKVELPKIETNVVCKGAIETKPENEVCEARGTGDIDQGNKSDLENGLVKTLISSNLKFQYH